MYNYTLINNHFIIDIKGEKYLLDTGSPNSFSFTNKRELIINNRTYPLGRPSMYVNRIETERFVGMKLDGFIGLDIIYSNGLTINKNGNIDFKAEELFEGKKYPIYRGKGYLCIPVTCNDIGGDLMIDTGAKYGYGIQELFVNKTPVNRVIDYSPSFGGYLESDLYNLKIDRLSNNLEVCYHADVERALKQYNVILIANIVEFFENTCVIDTKNGEVTFY